MCILPSILSLSNGNTAVRIFTKFRPYIFCFALRLTRCISVDAAKKRRQYVYIAEHFEPQQREYCRQDNAKK